MTTQAQQAARDKPVTLTDLLTKFWPALAALFLFVLTGFSIKKTQDFQEQRLLILEKMAQESHDAIIEIKSDIHYLKQKTDETHK